MSARAGRKIKFRPVDFGEMLSNIRIRYVPTVSSNRDKATPTISERALLRLSHYFSTRSGNLLIAEPLGDRDNHFTCTNINEQFLLEEYINKIFPLMVVILDIFYAILFGENISMH